MPSTKAKPPAASPALALTIGTVPYSVEAAAVPAGYRWAWRLTRQTKGGTISHVVSRSAARYLSCTCPAFAFRKGEGESCKHCRAVEAVELHRLAQAGAHRQP